MGVPGAHPSTPLAVRIIKADFRGTLPIMVPMPKRPSLAQAGRAFAVAAGAIGFIYAASSLPRLQRENTEHNRLVAEGFHYKVGTQYLGLLGIAATGLFLYGAISMISNAPRRSFDGSLATKPIQQVRALVASCTALTLLLAGFSGTTKAVSAARTPTGLPPGFVQVLLPTSMATDQVSALQRQLRAIAPGPSYVLSLVTAGAAQKPAEFYTNSDRQGELCGKLCVATIPDVIAAIPGNFLQVLLSGSHLAKAESALASDEFVTGSSVGLFGQNMKIATATGTGGNYSVRLLPGYQDVTLKIFGELPTCYIAQAAVSRLALQSHPFALLWQPKRGIKPATVASLHATLHPVHLDWDYQDSNAHGDLPQGMAIGVLGSVATLLLWCAGVAWLKRSHKCGGGAETSKELLYQTLSVVAGLLVSIAVLPFLQVAVGGRIRLPAETLLLSSILIAVLLALGRVMVDKLVAD